nr:MFS transporter [Sphingomonas sp. Y57]
MSAPENEVDRWPDERRAWLAFIGVAAAVLLAGLDRAIIGLLIEPLRADLALSDSQIGLLGLAFGLFYAIMALPFGWLVDRVSRVALLSGAMAFWSAMTVLSGLVASFGGLFVARAGVGLGEASLMPSSSSLLSDYFRPDRLPLAMGSFVAAGLFGASFAFIAGGWLFDIASRMGALHLPLLGVVRPWQTTLLAAGAAGMAASLLLPLIGEPGRKGRLSRQAEPIAFRQTLSFLRRRRRFTLLHNLGFGFSGLYIAALFLWAPSFLTRTYGWSMAQASLGFGAAMMVAGLPGLYGAGWLVSRMMRNGRKEAPLRIATLGLVALTPVAVAAPLMGNGIAALVLMSLSMLLFSLPAAAPQASLQLITPNELRGKAIALLTIAANAVGMILGPTSVAVLNDRVFGDPNAIHLSLSIVSGLSVGIAALLLGLALPEYRRRAELAAQGIFDPDDRQLSSIQKDIP